MSHKATEDQHFINSKAVAEILNISVRHVERMTATGEIPGAVKLGASRRYHLPTLLKHLEGRAKKSPRR